MAYKYTRLLFLVLLFFSLTAFINKEGNKGQKQTGLTGNRFLTFNAVIRVNQIEVSRNKNAGEDERSLHTPLRVIKFREAISKGFPGARITWALSWLALHDTTSNYIQIRDLVVGYHKKYGDEITFIPGAYFANAYNSTEQVNNDLHDGLARVSSLVGENYRPLSIVAGFLSSKNQEFLSEHEGIHVCQGNVWSQYAIDNQDGDGAPSYPYYPSKEHFCKPAQGQSDFIDCVNLDGWTMDFLSARRQGFSEGFNSRMGVGPIETLGKYGLATGCKEMLHTTAIHFDKGFVLNGFAWVTNCWEVSLPIELDGLTYWLSEIKRRWPDVKFITQGEFGMIWREHYKSNSFNYQFEEKGSGIGGSDPDKEIRWFMNKKFRLALLKDLKNENEMVIDFTRYDIDAKEPASGSTRNWSLMGEINQKQTRPQDKPVQIDKLPDKSKSLIREYYPTLMAVFAQKTPLKTSDIIPDFKSIPQIKWEFKANAAIFSSPVVSQNLVYSGGLDSILYAIDIQTGIEKWRFRTGGEIRSNVCIDDDKLYLNGGDGNLYALNKKSGKLLWTFQTKGERKYDFADYFYSTPVLKNKILYFGSGDGNMYAVTCDSGKYIWSFKAGNIVHSTPAIDNGKIFFGSFDGYVYALNLSDGKLIWKFKTVGHTYFPLGEVQGSPAAFNNLVFIGARDYNLYALDQTKGFCHWNKAFQKGWALSNDIHDSVLYTGTADERVLIAANPETGREIWKIAMEFLVFGNNAYSKDILYLGTTNGKLHAISKTSGEKIWSFETESYKGKRLKYFKPDDTYRDDIYSIIKSNEQFLDVECELGGVFSTPVISDDVIIFSSTNGTLYCLKR